MEISSSNLTLRLSLVEIAHLRPHEEVIEEVVTKLAQEIQEDGVVRDPLIVDQESHVILDGMHRFNSLKRLGLRFAPSCLLDYMSPKIQVGSWFRAFQVDDAKSDAERSLSQLRLDYSVRQLAGSEGQDSGTIILTGDKTGFTLRTPMDTLERCRAATNIEKQMVKGGRRVTYLSESIALQWLYSNRANLVITLPAFTKDAIRKFGLEGVLLPHKVTRHVIPSRPMGIDVPLSLLSDSEISSSEADQRLGKLLGERKVDRKPPGSVIEGRHYDEELLVFSS